MGEQSETIYRIQHGGSKDENIISIMEDGIYLIKKLISILKLIIVKCWNLKLTNMKGTIIIMKSGQSSLIK